MSAFEYSPLVADLIPAVHAAMDLPGTPSETRVVVAMSGGVDSSVTAALLKAAGYDVVGITLQLYDHGAAVQKKGACCAGQDIHDARRVAEALDMPHYVLDYESRFRQSVIDDFVSSYVKGETPIPCVRCNQTVKFRDLLDTARDLGAAALATGHYIRRATAPEGPSLHRAEDGDKDQSYFLFATTGQQLDFLRFPLGALPKATTRQLATDMGLIVADKPDSQDICFVPEGRYADVIRKIQPTAAQPGPIKHIDGQTLGQHEGVIDFTIGQRRGLGVATGDPLYVVRIAPEDNTVYVGPREALMIGAVIVEELNWLPVQPLDDAPRPINVKLRSTAKPVSAKIVQSGGQVQVVLDQAELGIAPGQAAVMYDCEDDTRLLGGGWITGTIAASETKAA